MCFKILLNVIKSYMTRSCILNESHFQTRITFSNNPHFLIFYYSVSFKIPDNSQTSIFISLTIKMNIFNFLWWNLCQTYKCQNTFSFFQHPFFLLKVKTDNTGSFNSAVLNRQFKTNLQFLHFRAWAFSFFAASTFSYFLISSSTWSAGRILIWVFPFSLVMVASSIFSGVSLID